MCNSTSVIAPPLCSQTNLAGTAQRLVADPFNLVDANADPDDPQQQQQQQQLNAGGSAAEEAAAEGSALEGSAVEGATSRPGSLSVCVDGGSLVAVQPMVAVALLSKFFFLFFPSFPCVPLSCLMCRPCSTITGCSSVL